MIARALGVLVGFASLFQGLKPRLMDRINSGTKARFCVNCRHHRVDQRIPEPVCMSERNREAYVSPVTGIRAPVLMTCEAARGYHSHWFVACGPSGKFFERAPEKQAQAPAAPAQPVRAFDRSAES